MSSVTAAETTTPTFVANLVAIGTRAMTLQARKLDQLPLKQNLLENVERYVGQIRRDTDVQPPFPCLSIYEPQRVRKQDKVVQLYRGAHEGRAQGRAREDSQGKKETKQQHSRSTATHTTPHKKKKRSRQSRRWTQATRALSRRSSQSSLRRSSTRCSCKS